MWDGDKRGVGYELYVLPVPPGGEPEEFGEALLALLRSEHVPPAGSHDELALERRVADRLKDVAGLEPAAGTDGPGSTLETSWGLEATVASRFVRFLVPFDWEGEKARDNFRTVFDALAAVVGETGWQVYDPQDASGVPVDDDGFEGTLTIYLSVMDQLRRRERLDARPEGSDGQTA